MRGNARHNPYRRLLAKAQFQRAQLETTQRAVDLWGTLLRKRLPHPWALGDARRIVELVALMEWGENTACMFRPEAKPFPLVEVENLDGRLMRLVSVPSDDEH